MFQFPGSSPVRHDGILIRLSETANKNGAAVTVRVVDTGAGVTSHVIGGLNPDVGYSVSAASFTAQGLSPFSDPVSIPAYIATSK